MNIRHIMLGVVGAAALTFTMACGDADRADRVDSPVAADRMDNDNWMRERDEYIAERENELNDIDSRWDSYQNRANAKSREAWNDVKQETAGMRRELNELKNASRENWEEAKARMDSGWDSFENKVNDVFDADERPNR
jgi:hypothetical protein